MALHIDSKCSVQSDSTWSPTSSEEKGEIEESVIPCEKQHWFVRLFRKLFSKKQTEEVEDEDPWQPEVQALDAEPIGYDQLAVFQSSDRNFLQYRGFRYLHCRVVSDLQYRLGTLEEELLDVDESVNREEPNLGREQLCSKRVDIRESKKCAADAEKNGNASRTRPDVLRDIRAALLDYDEMLLRTKEVMALPQPAKRDYESMINFFRGKEPIFRQEAEYICRKEDIVTLRSGRESAGFDGFVERCLQRLDMGLQTAFRWKVIQNVFLTEDLRKKYPGGNIKYFSPARIDGLVNILITMVVFVLLILPVVIMYEVTSFGRGQTSLDAIGVLIVFTLIFGMAVSCLTTARRHELFGASAAYAAVLVVFIGSFGVQQVAIQGSDGLSQTAFLGTA